MIGWASVDMKMIELLPRGEIWPVVCSVMSILIWKTDAFHFLPAKDSVSVLNQCRQVAKYDLTEETN